MNVRIGNDIRLNLTLKGPRNYDQANIKQLRAYLVNTSMQEYDMPWEPCNCSKGGCRINMCGKGGYHHSPFNFHHCCHDCCDYKYWLKPCLPQIPIDPYDHCYSCRHTNRVRVPLNVAFVEGPQRPNYGHPFHCDDHAHCMGCCGHKPCCGNHPGMAPHVCCDYGMPHINEDFRYLAPSRVLEGKNRIQVYFPACDQYACGVYKLVIVLVVYEAGWGRCDLHTYTIDYGDVVTLVDDNTGVSGDITLDVDNNTMSNSDIVEINVKSKDLYMQPNSNLRYGGEDKRGNIYDIEVTLSNGATVKYSPERDEWPYEDYLDFSSVSPNTARIVDAHGTIHSENVGDGSYTFITASSHKNPAVSVQFKVYIESDGAVTIPVTAINAPDSVNLNVGQVKDITIDIQPAGHTQNVQYIIPDINNDPIAVYQNGKIISKRIGTTTLTVVAGDKVKVITITVTYPTTPVQKPDSVSVSTITLYPTQKKTLPVTVLPGDSQYTLEYAVENTNTASVDNNGIITGIHVGITNVTVRTDNGKVATGKVNVDFPYDAHDITLKVGDEPVNAGITLKSGAPGLPVIYESSNENVFTVDSDGYITGVGVGEADLRIWINEVDYIAVGVTVLPQYEDALDVTPTNITFDYNEYDGNGTPVEISVTTSGVWNVEINNN